jgi:hypothetical protein
MLPGRREAVANRDFRIDDAAAESYSPLGQAQSTEPEQNRQLLLLISPTTNVALQQFFG